DTLRVLALNDEQPVDRHGHAVGGIREQDHERACRLVGRRGIASRDIVRTTDQQRENDNESHAAWSGEPLCPLLSGNPTPAPPRRTFQLCSRPMARLNENYAKLPAGYLFPEIGRRVRAYSAAHPDAKVIRLGIGDVTEPLAPAIVGAMHAAVDD